MNSGNIANEFIQRVINIKDLITSSFDPEHPIHKWVEESSPKLKRFSKILKATLQTKEQGTEHVDQFHEINDAFTYIDNSKGKSLEYYFTNHPNISNLFKKNIDMLEEEHGHFQKYMVDAFSKFKEHTTPAETEKPKTKKPL